MNIVNKKIGVFGLGLTGNSVIAFIRKYTENIICFDDIKNINNVNIK